MSTWTAAWKATKPISDLEESETQWVVKDCGLQSDLLHQQRSSLCTHSDCSLHLHPGMCGAVSL